MGMTNWPGGSIHKADAEVAKNYLRRDELEVLNRMVTAYLELAELQALNRQPMYMRDWVARLDDFLQMSGREILKHAGTVSHEQALEKARQEYEKYRQQTLAAPSRVEKDFLKTVKDVKRIESQRKRIDRKKGDK